MTPDGAVVIVPRQAIEAYALPGAPGRIVVSGRLLAALDERGRSALLAHEQAHLSGRHHLFTTAAHLAAAANPLLLPVARAVDYTVERWADESAASVTGDRRLVAATIGRVALLAPARPRRPAAADPARRGRAPDPGGREPGRRGGQGPARTGRIRPGRPLTELSCPLTELRLPGNRAQLPATSLRRAWAAWAFCSA